MIRKYILNALESFRFAVILVFWGIIYFCLKDLLLDDIPELFKTNGFMPMGKGVCNSLFVISGLLILGRKRLGVWLWFATIVIKLLLMYINIGFEGYETKYLGSIILNLAPICFLFLKKNGRTAWSILS